MLLSTAEVISAQQHPITFETGEAGNAGTGTTFENGSNPAVEIIDNPNKAGQNTSSKVMKFTALKSGNPWAGCESKYRSDIGSFSLTASNSTITIMVWKSEISNVGIKLVRPDAWSLGEIKVANTQINEWEKLTFNFQSNEGQTYDQIVIFPDFNTSGRAQDNVIYLDNIQFSSKSLSLDESQLQAFTLYPNPVTNQLYIGEVETFEISNASGQVAAQGSKSLDEKIDVTDLIPGFYTISIQKKGAFYKARFYKL